MTRAAASALDRVARGDLCAGCGLCESVTAPGKVTVGIDAAGYLRPQALAPLSAEEEARINRLCPGLTLTQTNTDGQTHPLWGPVIRTRIGHATDEHLRHHASSGGALSAILSFLLESGTVDAVVQTAADPARPIANRTVESVTAADIYAAAGSRYAPSAPLAGLGARLDRPGRFAFVGKPCDVAALRAYAREDARIAEKFPVMMSFFCAGVPSLAGARAILKHMGVDENDLAAFRYRGDGWPGQATATARDGRVARMSYAESWGAILSHHLQFRCKICPDGSGGFADLVCADAWYGDESGYPRFDEAPGRSLIVTRTAIGEDLLRQAIAAGVIACDPVDVDRIARMQPSQARRKRLVLSRLAAMAAVGRPVPRFSGLALVDAARQARPWETARSFLGTVRRLLVSVPPRAPGPTP